MFEVHKEEIEWCGRTLTLETGKIARKADAAVIATVGETVVFATVVSEKDAKSESGFLPLSVHYQEKSFSVGKIPGGYFKREGRPMEHETLISRLIDRPLRPMVSKGYNHETQVIVNVLSYDMENSPDIISIIAASSAMALSGVPCDGQIAATRVAYIDGNYAANPTVSQQSNSVLDLVVAGTASGLVMVESEAHELSEEIILGALIFGQEQYLPVLAAIDALVKKAGKPTRIISEDLVFAQAKKTVSDSILSELQEAYSGQDRKANRNAIDTIKNKVLALFVADTESLVDSKFKSSTLLSVFKDLQREVVRNNILQHNIRIDGRDLKTVRPISSEVKILPRAHGSSLFTRGETQALVVTTLGTTEDEQFVDVLDGTKKMHFMLHYNFPPYSVGEATRPGTPGRREIGHGWLAWRAINPLLPSKQEFPYTIRVVSEITESNGSSSMATVCGASLALMDAGVPIKSPVAGIAMGLVCEGDKYAIISDILGDEDFLGDMDFKVAGTAHGITALQMDLKIQGVSEAIMRIALDQAKQGRLHILGEMSKTISQHRVDLGARTPRMTTIKIPVDKIREVIGSGGKVIRDIIEKTGAKIEIKDDGSVRIFSSDKDKNYKAIKFINSIVAGPEIGEIYEGTVVKCVEFGAFVSFCSAKDGLVHISQLANYKVAKVSDIVKDGDKVWVKFLGFDERGKLRLSMREVDQETGLSL